MSIADPKVEEDIPENACEPVDDSPPVVDRSCVPKPKRKPGRPPGSLNKKTIAKQANDPPASRARTERPKAKRSKRPPSTSSSEQSVVVRRKKKRVVVIESDSSPSPVVVKQKRQRAPSPEPVAPSTVENLSKSLKDIQLERMLAQHAQYRSYFARLR